MKGRGGARRREGERRCTQGDLAAALAWPHPSPLLDEAHVCLLRLLALDEPRGVRADRALDLALLDAVTWPLYVWEYLRLRGDPLAALSAALARAAPPVAAPGGATALPALPRPRWAAAQRAEYYTLPPGAKATVLAALAGYALEAGCVRAEIDRREAAGEWVTGAGGAPGRWAMRAPEQRAARAADPAAQARAQTCAAYSRVAC